MPRIAQLSSLWLSMYVGLGIVARWQPYEIMNEYKKIDKLTSADLM